MTAPTAPAPAPAPRVRVDGLAPTPPKFGLLSAARVLDDVDPHELNGVEYESVCGRLVTPYPPPCGPVDTGLPLQKEAESTTSRVVADPMGFYAADDCQIVGRDQDQARADLRARFLAAEPAAIEQAVAVGQHGNSPTLADSALVLADGESLDMPDAVGLLEAWLADAIGTGVLHAPRYVANRIETGNRKPQGQQLQTLFGNVWAFGSYPGTAPLASTVADDGAVWLYATAPVTVRRSALVEPADWSTGALDIRTNTPFLLVERMTVVDWACRAAAVRTTIPRRSLATTGGES